MASKKRTQKKDWGLGQEKFRHRVTVKARTAGQKRYIQEIQGNDIVFCTGPAGSGKTAIAVGMALSSLLDASSGTSRIVVMRPVKEACGESIGYVPGDVSLKMQPWTAPIMDNMMVFIEHAQAANLMATRAVEVVPLAFARGRSLNDSFVIVDEAQNLSRDQVKMVLTRIGEGSKMVLNGDINQRDVQDSGLEDAMFRLRDLDGIGFAEMGLDDVVRHPLISEIIRRYDDGEA